MAKHYTVFVEFSESIDGRSPVTQSLEVYTAGPEFSVLLDALNTSPAVVKLTVYNKSQVNGHLHRMTGQDLGLVLEKLI